MGAGLSGSGSTASPLAAAFFSASALAAASSAAFFFAASSWAFFSAAAFYAIQSQHIDFLPLFGLYACGTAFFMPTIGLSNAIIFKSLRHA